MTFIPWYPRHEVPRRTTGDGLTGIYCQTCMREICRVANPRLRSVVKCLICQLREQGVEEPEKYVLAQYYQNDPTKPPVSVGAEHEDILINLFPEEASEVSHASNATGVAGTAKNIYRALGFAKAVIKEVVSKTVARKRRESTLFE